MLASLDGASVACMQPPSGINATSSIAIEGFCTACPRLRPQPCTSAAQIVLKKWQPHVGTPTRVRRSGSIKSWPHTLLPAALLWSNPAGLVWLGGGPADLFQPARANADG